MKTITLFFIGIIALIFISCEPEPWDNILTLERSYYMGDKIRFDGCYYRDSYTGSTYGTYIFYYRNGLLLSFIDNKGITKMNEFKNVNKLGSCADYWWLFKISKDTMITQSPYGSFGGGVVTYYKLIINDTTLQSIKKVDNNNVDGMEITYLNDIYFRHFIKMNPRPDSTNIFIK